MKLGIGAFALGCAAAAIAVGATGASAQPTGVSCVVPNLWKAEPQANLSKLPYQQSLFADADLSEGVARQIYQTQMRRMEDMGLREQMRQLRSASLAVSSASWEGSSSAAGSWKAAYKGTGYDRLTGAARASVARGGVLWTVKHRDLGVSAGQAIAALMDAGATVARLNASGQVEFRAPRSMAQDIAENAASSLGGGGSPARSMKHDAVLRYSAPSGGGMRSETAMLRLEGRAAQSPVQFIEQLPTSNMSVYQYGTSFVVHVLPSDLEQLRGYLEDQGNSVVLVGASAPLVEGWGIGGAIRSCGGNVLADRFPTPMVQSKASGSANIRIENQNVAVAAGDIMLVIQKPAYGTGLEIAIVRFIG